MQPYEYINIEYPFARLASRSFAARSVTKRVLLLHHLSSTRRPARRTKHALAGVEHEEEYLILFKKLTMHNISELFHLNFYTFERPASANFECIGKWTEPF
jgi:hypothetical protein